MADRYWTIIDEDNIGLFSYSSAEDGVTPTGYDSSTWIIGNHIGEVYDSGADTWSEPTVSVDDLRATRDRATKLIRLYTVTRRI